VISDEAKSPSPYEPTDGDLTSPKDREAIMRQWDYWRKRIVDGDHGSAPRDWFESVLDMLEGKLQTSRKVRKSHDTHKHNPGRNPVGLYHP
jgi:hypothetical protein